MPEKRTIRDITLESTRPRVPTRVRIQEESNQERPDASDIIRPNGTGGTPPPLTRKPKTIRHGARKGKRDRRTMWAIVVLILGVLGIFLATVFGSSKVIITPEQMTQTIDLSMTAQREATTDQLRFDLMTLKDSTAETVSATASQEVERKASGQIVVFNETTSVQRLREETRFESPDGLIYKTEKGPGITIPAAKGETPGQLEVTIYAENPGEEYNIGLTDFVIPGWREIDDARFETQYARSKTEMTGGFKGIERSVDPEEKTRVEEALGVALEERLMSSALAQKTDTFVFFPESVGITVGEVQQGTGDEEQVELVRNGELTAILFNKAEISRAIARQVLEGYEDEDIMITNFDSLVFALSDKESFDPAVTNTISFSLSGDAEFEWVIDKTGLAEKLAGVHKKSFNDVLPEFTGIKKAELSLTPFWRTRITDTPEKIHLEIEKSALQ